MTTPLAVIPEPAAATNRWPNCQWRVAVDDPQLASEIATCRHQRVRTPGQRVSHPVCQSCTMRLTESPPPPVNTPATSCCGRGPSIWTKGWNAAVAVAQFLADGATTLTAEEYQARLDVCEICDQRRNNTCSACGCNLTIKARGRAFACPLGKWPALIDSG